MNMNLQVQETVSIMISRQYKRICIYIILRQRMEYSEMLKSYLDRKYSLIRPVITNNEYYNIISYINKYIYSLIDNFYIIYVIIVIV